MLAKICSDWNKPDGQSYMSNNRDEILDFIGGLGVRKIPYIGGMQETTLAEMGIKTGQDLFENACNLMIAFTPHHFTFLIKCGMGIG